MKLNNISVSFDGKPVISDFSYDFSGKGIIVVVGESGSGKTTLFRVMAGLQPVDRGTVTEVPKKISYSFQEHRLLPWLNALQNVMSVSDQKDEKIALNLLNRMGITDEDAEKTPDKLSGGMRQRVAIARALYYNADIYLFDELFAGLDAENVKIVADLLKEKAQDALVVVITHENADVLGADKTIVMEKIK